MPGRKSLPNKFPAFYIQVVPKIQLVHRTLSLVIESIEKSFLEDTNKKIIIYSEYVTIETKVKFGGNKYEYNHFIG